MSLGIQINQVQLPQPNHHYATIPNITTITFDTRQDLIWVGYSHVSIPNPHTLTGESLIKVFAGPRGLSHRITTINWSCIPLSRHTRRMEVLSDIFYSMRRELSPWLREVCIS